jgi:hypothetical protein
MEKFGSRIRDSKKLDLRSGLNIPDSQHWVSFKKILAKSLGLLAPYMKKLLRRKVADPAGRIPEHHGT